MTTMTYFNELTISTLIQKINEISPLEYIVFENEFVDKIGAAKKAYRVKFQNEDEFYFMHLTDQPFKLDDGKAYYGILFETIYGRFFSHEINELNTIVMNTAFKSFDELESWAAQFGMKTIE